VAIVNNPAQPQMVIQVITHLTPVISQSLAIRKLLLLYWEVVDKVNPDGTPCEEILLACNGLRNDLLGHNEFMRGRSLRLLARMNDRNLVEPLHSAVLDNVEHPHSYVRRGALFCLQHLYTTCPEIFDDCDEIA
jgi:coatomer subunit beta